MASSQHGGYKANGTAPTARGPLNSVTGEVLRGGAFGSGGWTNYRQRNASSRHGVDSRSYSSARTAPTTKKGGTLVHAAKGWEPGETEVEDASATRRLNVAQIPYGTPDLPNTYAERSLYETVVSYVIDPERLPLESICLYGKEGGGKTTMASWVVRDIRTRLRFSDGVFWVSVGPEGRHQVTSLLGNLAQQFTRGPGLGIDKHVYDIGASLEIIHYLRYIHGERRCLVVLDDVWHTEVIQAFGQTGFHLLVTTHTRFVIPPKWSGKFAEVGEMHEKEALRLLSLASGAEMSLLPEEEAKQVAGDCGMLPMALCMAGVLARDQPHQPSQWLSVHEELQARQKEFAKSQEGSEESTLFPVIAASFERLRPDEKKKLLLLATMARGLPVTPHILANLWNMSAEDVSAPAGTLVGRCLLQSVSEHYYIVHSLMVGYLQHVMRNDDLRHTAISRQVRYLTKVNTLRGLSGRSGNPAGGTFMLMAQWYSLKELGWDLERVKESYMESLWEAGHLEDWDEAGKLLQHLGDYPGALEGFRKVLEESREPDHEPEEVASAMNNLALAMDREAKRKKADDRHQEAKNLEMEAGSLYEHATAPENEMLGLDDPALAPILNNFAIFKLGKGEAKTAHELHERGIELVERSLGPDHLSLVGWLHNRALLLEEQGLFEEANYHHMRILMILENHLGTDHPEFASRLNNRAIVLWRLHEIKEADAELAMAISIGERTLGEENTDVASWIGNRAILLAIQGKYDKADELFLRAIGISGRNLGDDHLTSALHRANRANLLMKKGKYEDADKLYQSSIKIATGALGSRHPTVVRIRHNSATCKLKQDTTAGAREAVKRTIHIGEKVLGAQEVAAWAANFAASQAREARSREHRDTLDRALEMIKGSPWEECPDHPSRLRGRALMMRKHGKSMEAESLYVEAIKAGERILGKEHPDLAHILNGYADLLLMTHRDRLEEIEELNARAISIAENNPGAVHPRISNFRKTRAYLQERKARLMAQQPDEETPDGHMQRDSTPPLRHSSHSSPRAGCFGCGQCFTTHESR